MMQKLTFKHFYVVAEKFSFLNLWKLDWTRIIKHDTQGLDPNRIVNYNQAFLLISMLNIETIFIKDFWAFIWRTIRVLGLVATCHSTYLKWNALRFDSNYGGQNQGYLPI